MQSHARFKAALATCLLVAAIAALAVGGSASAAPGAHASACTKAKNVEAIIDDSGSMALSDPDKFRTKLLDAFANLGSNNGRIFGGIEFGSAANVLFGPGTIPGVIVPMDASFVQVDADNGGTDFDLAFSAANGHNGTADARIFLTDGLADMPTSHKSPNIKTYVVALGDISSDPTAQQTLSQIAADTGGPAPFLVSDASQLQPVAGAITAGLDCKRPPLTFTHTFNHQGESVKYGFKPAGKSADVLVSWGNSGTVLDAIGFSVAGGGGHASVARVSKAHGPKARKKKGSTFVTVHLKGLKKGKKLKFKVKAKKLAGATIGTTQVIR
jgi:hypothetical protein